MCGLLFHVIKLITFHGKRGSLRTAQAAPVGLPLPEAGSAGCWAARCGLGLRLGVQALQPWPPQAGLCVRRSRPAVQSAAGPVLRTPGHVPNSGSVLEQNMEFQ